MQYIKNHIPKSIKRPGTKILPKYITIHSTGNPKSTAANERSWLTNPTNTTSTSWHICVDEKEAIEAVPLEEIAYHAGNAQGNKETIGIEICESGSRLKTLANAVELTAGLLYERNWEIGHLRRHYDWSGKKCPAIFAANDWQGWKDFRTAVALQLAKLLIENSEKIESVEDIKNIKAEEIEMRYKSLNDLPDWGKPAIQKMIDGGAFADISNLNLSEDMLRIFVLLERLGKI